MFTDSQGPLHDPHRGESNLLPAQFPPSGSRATSLQPFPRPKSNRPRKSSITESARKSKHERQRSKDQKRMSHDRKATSAEPGSVAGVGDKRWIDLLDAAASATEEDSRDLTPVSVHTHPTRLPFIDMKMIDPTVAAWLSPSLSESESQPIPILQYLAAAALDITTFSGAYVNI